jgi:glycosyltransferase involved in cell wall biosynthesis
MKIGFISHCNFQGNSAMHVFSLANELKTLGHECCVLVPDSPESVHGHGEPSFAVLDYEGASQGGLCFRRSAEPDILHAWSPREHVREITTKLAAGFQCPYAVHMEDNEEQIVEDELSGIGYRELRALPEGLIDKLMKPYRSHPLRYRAFVERAEGYSCLIDRLIEFKPEHMPAAVFWPGFDPPFKNITAKNYAARSRYGLTEDTIIVLYSGNVHLSNVNDVRYLYMAVGLLHRRGFSIKLVRTGWTYANLELDDLLELNDFVVDLGFIPRKDVPDLIAMSDILIQPGRADPFNDYRFPSKLPEYLVSGRPVILPDSNIGTRLKDGLHVLKLRSGSIKEIMSTIQSLIASPELRQRLGENSRSFALEHLTWEKAAKTLDRLYRVILEHHGEHKQSVVRTDPKARADNKPSEPSITTEFPTKLISFYLPQFHPIPENDEWWGAGFTEWTNVVRATPNFRYHSQPRFPTELGFYDLRVGETLHKHVDLAKSHGIYGFCFYYYWFNGRRLLERPLDLWLSPKGPDFPFCICWANESWSRRWDGSETEVLMPQTYEAGSEARFFEGILPILKDPRYIQVDGAPALLLYRVTDIDDPVRLAQSWRRIARENGIERLHLCVVQSFGIGDPRPYGFDAAVEFMPAHTDRMLVDPARIFGINPNFQGYLEDYISVAMRAINQPPVDYVRYRGIFPQWDNTPRRKAKGHIVINGSPKAYAQWLRFLVREAMVRRQQQDPLIFINAWNEWGEGAYLEPDETFGRAFLDVTHDALCEGIIDHVLGPTPEREREFTRRVTRLPKGAEQ